MPVAAHLDRRDLADALDQVGIARRAEPDVVRKQRRADHVVVTVHRVRAPHDGDRRTAGGGIHRRVVEPIRERDPVAHARMLLVARECAAAVEHRAERGTCARRCGVTLRMSACTICTDLLLERHARAAASSMRASSCGSARCSRRAASRRRGVLAAEPFAGPGSREPQPENAAAARRMAQRRIEAPGLCIGSWSRCMTVTRWTRLAASRARTCEGGSSSSDQVSIRPHR